MRPSTALLPLAGAGAVMGASIERRGNLAFSAKASYNHKNNRTLAADAGRVNVKFGSASADGAAASGSAPGASNSKNSGGPSVGATPLDETDVLYYIDVEIGSPPQKLQLDADTGSSDTWVMSTDTDPSQARGHTLYNPSASSTSRLLTARSNSGFPFYQDTGVVNATWSIAYGDQSTASGLVYLDTLSIGGAVVKNQAIESAKQISSSFRALTKISGLLGLAHDQGNQVRPEKQKTWFSNLLPQLKKPLFTVRLKHDNDGTYNFGWIDQDQYEGDIVYTQAKTNNIGYRLLDIGGYQFGNQRWQNYRLTITPDTGTSLLYLPNIVARHYYDGVPGVQMQGDWFTQNAFAIPCNSTLPDFTFAIEGKKFTIPGSEMVFGDDGSDQMCLGAMIGQPYTSNVNIFGDIVLKHSFVVFNDGDNTIGWAKGK